MESVPSAQPNGETAEDHGEHKPQEDIEQGRKTAVHRREDEEIPRIFVSWSLNPTTHSYSNDVAPTLSLALTSHADRPLTIYNDSVLPRHMLVEGKFVIFDVTSNVEVPQRKSRLCFFEPPSKVQVPLREHLFHTLYPEVPVVFETAFGRATGVDGLEPEHHYRLGPGQGWGYVRWWEYGEKEEVMNPPSGKLDGRRIAYRHSKNPHQGIYLETGNMSAIDFWCTEA
ncbi:hypothetical protein MMC07_000445 [Pseudocyphellaria aurata]|nr:hypothetical protein [Pseudocyphellaria aurata]